jgi:tetratricopeptide (TPR) repeat protein
MIARTRTALAGVLVAILTTGGLLLWGAGASCATGAKTSADPQADPAPCVAAAAADDADRIVAVCGALIDDARTAKPDRIRALVARAGAHDRRGMIGSAIGDYDAAQRLDPALADVFNSRGELWRRKGDRRRALADFAAAIKLNPDHAAAKANHKALAQELERDGAQLAVAGKPSFDCAAAKRAVEKAICADPELADLDREINDMHIIVVREAVGVHAHMKRGLRRDQEVYLAKRTAAFGRPGYDLRKAMKARLRQIVGADGF